MKVKTPNLISVCLLVGSFLLGTSTAQAATSDQQQMNQELQQVLSETQQLQKQIDSLNAEVKELRYEKEVAQSRIHSYRAKAKRSHVTCKTTTHTVVYTNSPPPPAEGAGPSIQAATPSLLADEYARKRHGAKYIVRRTQPPVRTQLVGNNEPVPAWLQGERLTQGITVTTSPLLGIRSAFDASDLVVNISTMNEDLRLLQQRQKLENVLCSEGITPIWKDRALIELSGALEAQTIFRQPFTGHASSDIDLTRAEIDTLAYYSPEVLGITTFAFDNSPLPPNIIGSGQRIANSRLFLKRGFISVGNLNVSPFYFTIGQMFVPFGIYTSQLLTSPMTVSIGQTNERTALVGFYDKGLYSEIYAFHGNASSNSINNGGGNLGYKYDGDKFSFNVGGGYLIDLADSIGLQLTGNPLPNSFQGFSFNNATEAIQHKVGGADVHAELDIEKLTLLAEYVGATGAFAFQDMSFNGDGARPQALQLEGDYSISAWDRFPTVLTLAFSRSWQALAVNVPRISWFGAINTSFWKNTIETIEFRHDINYSPSNTFSGQGFPVPINSSGGTQNTVTLQIGAYF